MLGLRTSQDSNNIKLNGLDFRLTYPEVRSQLYSPVKLYNNTYQIDYRVMFPEIMPNQWCVALQMLQVSKGNNVKNPTLQMNVKGDTCFWQHKTVEVGAGDVFCESYLTPNIEDHWRITIAVAREYHDNAYIIIERNGAEIGRISGQTVVDVEQPPEFSCGLYSRDTPEVDKKTRRCTVTEFEVIKL